MGTTRYSCACVDTITKDDGSMWQCGCNVIVENKDDICHICASDSHVRRKIAD